MGAAECFHLLQVSSASSEPSGHSGSPSHRQRPGTHWPFKQANSAGAHVFLAAHRERNTERTLSVRTVRQGIRPWSAYSNA